jgi:hypothetical protein
MSIEPATYPSEGTVTRIGRWFVRAELGPLIALLLLVLVFTVADHFW